MPVDVPEGIKELFFNDMCCEDNDCLYIVCSWDDKNCIEIEEVGSFNNEGKIQGTKELLELIEDSPEDCR